MAVGIAGRAARRSPPLRHSTPPVNSITVNGRGLYRHSPPHKSEPVVTYLIGLHKGGDIDPNRDAGVASGGGGHSVVGLRYGTQASRQPAAPISSSSAVDPVIAIGRAGIPQSARQQRSAACREFKASRLDCCPSSANRPVLWNRRRVIGDGLHGAVAADGVTRSSWRVDAFAGHPGAPGHSADGDGGVLFAHVAQSFFDAGARCRCVCGWAAPRPIAHTDPPTMRLGSPKRAKPRGREFLVGSHFRWHKSHLDGRYLRGGTSGAC